MNEKKNDFWPEIARPFVILVVICLVASALLGLTYNKTAPIVAENARIEAIATRKAMLPEASDFEEMELTDELRALGVKSVFRGDNLTGYVITAGSAGYGGEVTVTVGLDAFGQILNMKADVSTETQGVGSKVGEMTGRFEGLTFSDGADNVELKSGATFTSNAVRTAVNAVFAAFMDVATRK